MSYKWNPITYDPLCLASFTSHNVFTFHPYWYRCRYPIPSCGRVPFHCRDTSHLVCLSVKWWTFGLLPAFDRLCTSLCLWTCDFISLGGLPEAELLDHMLSLCLTFRETTNCFLFLHPHQYLWLSLLLTLAILVGVKCYLTVVFICVFLMSLDIGDLPLCFVSSCLFSLEKYYSNRLPIFKWDRLRSY